LEELEPRLRGLALVNSLVRVSPAADHEYLHVLGKKRIVSLLYDDIDERVGHEILIEVLDIADQLILEISISQSIEEGLVFSNWLVRQNDLLGIVTHVN